MKCIVQSLLDENAMELREELMKTEGLQLDANLEDEDVQVLGFPHHFCEVRAGSNRLLYDGSQLEILIK